VLSLGKHSPFSNVHSGTQGKSRQGLKKQFGSKYSRSCVVELTENRLELLVEQQSMTFAI
jgi:hypothetical protein